MDTHSFHKFFLTSFCIGLSSILILSPALALKNCSFPAIFNFGDSNTDTGTDSAAFSLINPPYGETFFHKPAGRPSDERLTIDFIGLFGQALYRFDIGQNDLGLGLFIKQSPDQIKADIPDIISKLSKNVQVVYGLGGRSFWIHNTGPLGCFTYILTRFPVNKTSELDQAGCAIAYNELSQFFNQKLKEAVVELRQQLPLAAITLVDIYSVKYLLFSQPNRFGFQHPQVACCGIGGKFNFSIGVRCGQTTIVDGKSIFIGSCADPSVRVTWDGSHLTEAANKFIVDQISTGKFSDPPL